MSAYAEQYTLQGSRVDINKIYLDPNGQPLQIAMILLIFLPAILMK